MTKSAKPSAPRKARLSAADLVRMPVVYTLPGMETVEVRENVTYRKLENAELAMDLYLPRGSVPGAKRPAVIFIHGGPIPAPPRLQPKDWRCYRDHGRLAAASGFVGVTFNHRFHGLDRILDAQSDIEELISAVRRESRTFGIDEDRLALWAFSGGGIFLAEPIRHPSAFVRGLIGFYTVMDLHSFLGARANRAPDNGTLTRFSAEAAIDETSGPVPPLLIARAGLDNPALKASIDRFVRSALKKSLSVVALDHPAGHHGFDILDDDDTSRDIIRQTYEFLNRVLL